MKLLLLLFGLAFSLVQLGHRQLEKYEYEDFEQCEVRTDNFEN